MCVYWSPVHLCYFQVQVLSQHVSEMNYVLESFTDG